MKKFKILLSKVNCQRSIVKGFTLIELLIAIGLFGTLATLIISVLFVSFRTSKKSDAIITIKQSGDVAMAQMVGGIRFARSLDDPTTCVPDVTNLNSITITSLDGGQTKYSCPSIDNQSISSNSAALLNVNSVAVVADSCSFSCLQTTTDDPPTIVIKFKLTPVSSTDFADSVTSMPFQTSVTMRNYNR